MPPRRQHAETAAAGEGFPRVEQKRRRAFSALPTFPAEASVLHPRYGALRTFQKLFGLAKKLQRYLGFPGKWAVQMARLLMFIVLLLPGFLPLIVHYVCSRKIVKNVVYGAKFRHQLDIFVPRSQPQPGEKVPIVIFISGGAWIIGYKAWGFIMGQVFQRQGVLFIAPDYRNFPEVSVPDMVDDVVCAVGWILARAEGMGGDLNNVTLMGQSAGAHLSAMAIIRQAQRETKCGAASSAADPNGDHRAWSPSAIRRWVGVSGPYDIINVMPLMKERGLPSRVVRALMDNDLTTNSPTRLIRDFAVTNSPVVALLPEMCLFHGTADVTVEWQQSEEFAAALKQAGAKVSEKYYKGKSHTDPILEDPLLAAGDPLMEDLLELIHPHRTCPRDLRLRASMQPQLLLKW
eukprot:CAMPEP_0204328968 /NCGR_PEP_ID=MMETSP0469-20131031/13808_1 /ASSEMBLY_ACC=CAM_ASM_000384 /TAXON_ID=2969 /ORGANISM="Oxyrrhis marina" /LENGTH=403 /DNA_ID=CAMNT_0051311487 /DNA_START=22 /DNA_END=1230 /DNA_ORIENTATION=+